MSRQLSILLLLPLWERELQWGKFARGAGNNNFNYGLASIAGVLRDAGYSVNVFDPNLYGFDEDQLIRYLRGKDHQLIGIPCYTPTVVEVYETARICKAALPDCRVIVGGVHPSLYPEVTLRECGAIDYVCIGEGEYLMLDLAKKLSGAVSENFSGIRGLGYRDNGTVTINGPRELIEDLSELPIPAYDLFELEKYELQPTIYRDLPTFTMVASRGCPYSCSFCHIHAVLGHKARYKSVDALMCEIEYLISNHGARGIAFQDGTFTVNRGWVEDLCKAFIREKVNLSWMCFTRADNVSRSLLKLMKEAGCYGISFGVESFNQKSLDLLNKRITVEQNVAALEMALGMGFYVTATYIICCPGETRRDSLHTIRKARSIGTHIAHFFFPLPYPKTALWTQCEKEGGLREDLEWKHYSVTSTDEPVYVNPLIGKEEQKRLQEYALKSYYLDPGVISRNIRTVRSFQDVRKFFKAGLALSGFWI